MSISDIYLKTCALGGIILEMEHGVEHLLVAAGHQTHGPQNLQHRRLGLDVVRGQTLGDDVDALWMS